MQHVTATNSPNPADVGINTLVKYDLVDWNYVKPDGSFWDNMSVVKDIKVKSQSKIFGCAMAQLTDTRVLKFEVFVGKQCSSVAGFDSSAKTYTR